MASLRLSNGHPFGRFYVPLNQIVSPGTRPLALADAGSVADIYRVLREDTHPPLYSLVLRAWRTMVGESDSAARFLSLIFTIISILLLYDSARLLHGTRAALWAAAIAALATPQIRYAQEIRGYAMWMMWTAGAICLIVRIEKLGPSMRRLVLLGLCVMLSVMSHYWGVTTGGTIALYAMIRLRSRTLISVLCALAASGVLFLILNGSLVVSQRGGFYYNMNWAYDERPEIVQRTIHRVMLLPARLLAELPRVLIYVAPVGIIVFLIVPLLRLRKRGDLLIWCLLFVAVAAAPAMGDLWRHSLTLTKIRYCLPAGLAIYALAGAIFSDARGWRRDILPGLALLACMISLPWAYVEAEKPDYRGFAAQLDARASADDLLIFHQKFGDTWSNTMLQSANSHYSKMPLRPMLVLTEPATSEVLSQIRAAKAAWLVRYKDNVPMQQFLGNVRTEIVVDVPSVGQAVRLDFTDPPATMSAPAPTATSPTTPP